jgi:2-phosphosulfolactate phosphatase
MSHKTLRVHYLPELVSPEALRGATVVVLDVLRASTTIATALAAGAKEVIPFLDVEQVRAAGKDLVREEIVLGGERRGVKIDLFDLGNSPSEYTAEVVGGKTVLFTTTNGTKAMERCREAHRVMIGAPVNLAAICRSLAETLNVHLLCAGTGGRITREDILAAGAITYQLTKNEETAAEIDDCAHVARSAWRSVVAGAFAAGETPSVRLAREFRSCSGGQNLLSLGYEADLTACAAIDSLDCVPELDLPSWRILLP